jgi:hypothetical protein
VLQLELLLTGGFLHPHTRRRPRPPPRLGRFVHANYGTAIKLKKSLAFFASVGLSDCSRYLVGFFVPKLKNELPFGTEASWVMPLYGPVF